MTGVNDVGGLVSRSGAFSPLLVAAVVVGPVVLIGGLVGARRARMILRAALADD
jgi:hypothetical protein